MRRAFLEHVEIKVGNKDPCRSASHKATKVVCSRPNLRERQLRDTRRLSSSTFVRRAETGVTTRSESTNSTSNAESLGSTIPR